MPQGAPTSPYLASMICQKLDKVIFNYCKRRGFIYTRYFDDISISGKNILDKNVKQIQAIISRQGFDCNKEKTEFFDFNTDKVINRELTPNEEYLDVLKEAIKLAHQRELAGIASLEKKTNLKISEVKDKKEKLLNLRIEGKISDDDFMPANEKCKLEIIYLEKELNEISSPELEVNGMINSGIEFIKSFPEIWQSLNVKDLRVLRNLFFPSNLVYHYPTIKTPEVCCIYNIKPEFLDTKYRQVTSPYLEWNTIENMVISWNRVFTTFNLDRVTA